ncbi:helix-turn-helix domain-containing protein [Rhizosphaericola mali]|uniref:Helix-turn-helix domain-containing protein n=1 Tax=Rhizosphaericola mali TaxID=2545455 RepID=A0A5P2G7C7_9BACT|nr:helix-turn-helix domain-containing protein [Rhizosphaericola mali]QES89670.1 helix-turn-helix domain-containing protein [Rhizosphaericola mali]
MNSNKKEIKEYGLSDSGTNGILIKPLDSMSESTHDTSVPHRDDHYQLLFAFEGQYKFRIDFEEIEVKAPFFLWTEPGQIHQLVKSVRSKGWMLGIENLFLEDEFKKLLDSSHHHIFPVKEEQLNFQQSIDIILERAFLFQTGKQSVYIHRAIFHLVNTVLCLLIQEAGNSTNSGGRASKEKRAYIIEQEFRALLKRNYKAWKSPSQYAGHLSLTTAHLNDSIKEVTGKSVTAHLQEQCIMEAKRLLYFTDLEVREIAFTLGFEDPVYFGRLFRKLTGMTPLGFRNKFRD